LLYCANDGEKGSKEAAPTTTLVAARGGIGFSQLQFQDSRMIELDAQHVCMFWPFLLSVPIGIVGMLCSVKTLNRK